MPNPLFNEASIEKAGNSWGPPKRDQDRFEVPRGAPGAPPLSDGPVTPWSQETMTVGGTISAALVLFTLLLVSAAFGWAATQPGPIGPDGTQQLALPGLAMMGVVVGFGLAITMAFKPKWARVLGPLYALAQGFAVGAISKAFESAYDGIVVQAAAATVSVFFVMLVLFRTGIIKVTDRFRRIVVGATMGVMVLYVASFLIGAFGGNVSFLSSPSLLGIGFSVLVCGLAAFNLALDFDLIERGVAQGLPKHYEWFAAFGLLVTMVWLYLEFLRLLAKLRNN
jgi:uncharacterized YccA/Bax inhibitor family protein